MSTLLVAHAAVTWFLVGLIWTIQVVHYPLFARVGRDRFVAYHAGHTRRISSIVAVAMPLEAALALAVLVLRPAGTADIVAWTGVALVVLVWGVTAFIQVPDHRALERGFDQARVRRLVRGNLVRTLSWTARGGLAAWMLLRAG